MERPQKVLDELRQLVSANEINNIPQQKLERYIALLAKNTHSKIVNGTRY